MVKFITSIGIPGSGKTTAMKEFAEKYGYDYISPDDIRWKMTGEYEDRIAKPEFWQEKNKEVWSEVRRKTKEFLVKGDTVVLDTAFTSAKARKEFLNFARESGAEKIQGIYFDVPIEVAKERNLKRDRKVPAPEMDRMNADLSGAKPKIEEGFDAIFTLNEYQELADVERKIEGEDFKAETRQKR